MKTLRVTLRPLSAFGTPLVGDTLFGHLCWALLERRGESGLAALLDGYTEGRPALAVSDAFPHGLLPRPTAPDAELGVAVDASARKARRRARWLPADGAGSPVARWMEQARAHEGADTALTTQNTIDRMTGTTGTGPFAPRQVERLAFRGDARLDVYAAVDEDRLDAATLEQALADVGTMGYGRDASTGLGKFAVESIAEHRWRAAPTGYWLALAPCAPPGQGLDVAACRYLPVTRFGRHGSVAARSATPFKRPVLLAATGAMLVTVDASQRAVIGSGLGGEAAPVSRAMPATVHQGYAPVVPLNMEPHR